MIALLVMTDGRRDCIMESIPSAFGHLDGKFSEYIIHDDSGDADYQAWLRSNFPQFELITTLGRRGFGGAIRNAWAHIAARSESHFVFHLEDDFTFNEHVDVNAMARLLVRQPTLVQVALKRQPWNDVELAAGGIVEANPQNFLEMCDGGAWCTVQRVFFTTNPCLYHTSLVHHGWPDAEHSEGVFSHEMTAHRAGHPFAFWGRKFDPPKVTHIGAQRAGTGY